MKKPTSKKPEPRVRFYTVRVPQSLVKAVDVRRAERDNMSKESAVIRGMNLFLKDRKK